MTPVVEPLLGWSLAASLALAMGGRTLRDGQRRGAINEALHELRRPLQAIALAADSPDPAGRGALQSSLPLASAALRRLEQEVNGESHVASPELVGCEQMLRAAVGRWGGRANAGKASLALRWWAGDVAVRGERSSLEQALDNLIVNAIEHGGPEIVVEGSRRGDRVCISVSDSGPDLPVARRRGASALAAVRRLGGRRGRRGHGLAVVRRVAAEHGGVFALRHGDSGSLAAIVLPLAREVRPAA